MPFPFRMLFNVDRNFSAGMSHVVGAKNFGFAVASGRDPDPCASDNASSTVMLARSCEWKPARALYCTDDIDEISLRNGDHIVGFTGMFSCGFLADITERIFNSAML